MHPPLRLISSLCAATALCSAGVALAQPATESPWGVGLGTSTKHKAYAGMGTSTTVIPLISYENRWVRFAGPLLDIKLPTQGAVSLTLRARYAFEDGYEASDAPVLSAMAERKASVWLGASALWRSSMADLSVEWLGDASGHSKGQRLRLAAEKSWRVGQFVLAPRLAVQWHDRKSVNYYYGVRDSEARAGRAAYAGRATTHTELGLRTAYTLAPQQSVYADLSATRLGSAVRNSPLVGRSTETALRLGYLYRF